MSQTQRTVLMIDDSQEDCELIKRYLQQQEDYLYNFIQTETGEEGLKLYGRYQPDVLLLDYQLADLTGLEFLKQLQTQTRQLCLPVIIVTALGNEAIAVQCLKAGAQDYLVKEQISAQKLLLAIDSTIERVKLQLHLNQRIQSERVMAHITQQIYQSLDLDQVLQTTVDQVRQFLKTDRVVIFRFESDHNGRVLTESLDSKYQSLLNAEIEDIGLVEAEIKLYHQGQISSLSNLENKAIDSQIQVQAELVVPILHEKQLWGLLIAHSCQKSRWWQPLEIELLQQLTTQVAIAIRQAELYQQTQAELQQRREAETIQKESETRFRIMANNAPVMIWMSGVDKLCNFFNQPWLDFTGRTLKQELGNGWTQGIHPEDLERCWNTYSSSFDLRREFKMEYRLRRADGKYLWVLDHGVPRFCEEVNFAGYIGSCIEINDRKRVEEERQETAEALRTSEEFKQRILESSSDCIKLLDLNGRLLYMNAGGICLMEIEDFTCFLNAEWVNFWQGESQAAARKAIATAKAGKIGKFQGLCSTAKGTSKWWDVVVTPIHDATGQVIQLLSVSRDITDRKQTEEALRQSEVQFRTLADNMSQFAWMTDQNGWIFWYNRRWFEYTGTTLESMQGWGWQKVHHPEHLDRVVRYFSHCIKTGQLWEDTFPLRGKDGIYRWFLSRATPIRDEQGQIICWFGTNTDIDDQKQIEEALRQSEERYRCLAELIPQLIWTTDTEGVVLDVNQRWTEYTGLTLAQAQSQGWENLVYPEDLPSLTQHWAAALQAGTYYQAEGRMRRADGSYRWHLHQAVPQKNEQGQIIKWFGTATDIELQKQLERERDRLLQLEQSARAAAEQANRVKDEFLAILSHELRSPLNPILGWTQLMQSNKFDSTRISEGLAIIERNAKLQTQLIDDLLDVAKILRGKLNLNLAPVNLEVAIRQAIETVNAAAVAKSIVIEPLIAKTRLISGDYARIQQIIWNLLSNAIKFTPNGGKVEIRLQQVGNQAQIIVIDTGKGIKPDFLPYIFESFRQEDLSISRKHGGLGLGLSIVRYLVEAHGGKVSADSLGENQGATFTVELPLIEIEPATNQTERLLEHKIDLTGIRILTIDDHPDARLIQTLLLNQYGAEVMSVASVAEFWQALSSFQPHILISDIGMPEVDGYTLLRQLRSLPAEQGGQIPAIALTAYAGETERQKAIAVGFQQHLAKPINSHQLVQAVVKLVSKPTKEKH
ncbi:multi-sensor hybrid histidine kinase [Stanieria cyanosphaera PCC 7437]|uniref:histidine kinase n=1 Tax=Stanieria cyanosphaera (strain ATCC 29371 / PCC 7437) TaxID=111780 RepID=K9XPJ1_STAC7|nr:PAS domain S-box protein [Stanieria cyanosphaera]AFZ33971.1 multi-sensor hybrid histidine kinase [Stanieria cyanosphaera PCC 7437]